MADDRANGFDRIVTGLPVGIHSCWVQACFPCGVRAQVGQRLEGSVVYGGNPNGLRSSDPGFGIHTRRTGAALVTESQGMRERQPLLGGQGLTPSTPAVFFPWLSWVTLRTARTFADQDSSTVVGACHCATLTRREAREEALLKLENFRCIFFQGIMFHPSIGDCARVHSILAACRTLTFHVTVVSVSYLMAFPGRLLVTTILSLRLRLTPAPLGLDLRSMPVESWRRVIRSGFVCRCA